jgi:hypothetical protein
MPQPQGPLLRTCTLATVALAALITKAPAQDLNLSATRPTIANSAAIQSAGVLQVELGYDAYPQQIPAAQHAVATNFFYAPLPRLRLDFAWSPFTHERQDNQTTQGIGTIQLGGKVEFKKEDYHRPAPGIALQYEAELPTASDPGSQNYGQQVILLLNHHYGKQGDLDVILNGSIVQANCQTPTGCSYGGQQSFALSYQLQKETRLYAEVFGQNNSASNTPPGTYVFGGFYHQFAESFGIDGGIRFGVSDQSASIGTTIGVVLGKRLHGSPQP